MTGPDLSTHLARLELGERSTPDEVVQAHRRLFRLAQKRATNAPLSADRARYETLCRDLDASKTVLLEHLTASPAPPPPVVGPGLYAVLDLPASAPEEQVREAAHDRVRRAQHRRSSAVRVEDRQAAERELAQLTEARAVLLDPERRAEHDRRYAPSDDQASSEDAPEPTGDVPTDRPVVPPLRDDGLVERAQRQYAAGRHQDVVRMLDAAVRADDPDPRAARLHGLAAWRAHDGRSAARSLALARRHFPGDPELAGTLVEAYAGLGRDTDASSVVRLAVGEDETPGLSVSRAVMQALCAKGRPDLAVRLAEELLPQHPRGGQACLTDTLLSAADAYRTRLQDGRLVLTNATQCEVVSAVVERLRVVEPADQHGRRRLRALRVQLMDARRTVTWVSGARWQPRGLEPEVLVERWGKA